MAFYKYLVWMLAIVPTIIFGTLIIYSPRSIIGNEILSTPLILSLLGVALSYYGLIFSSYAALQVQAMSNIYFFRIRSPELQKKLEKISRAVSEFGNEPSDDLRSQRFISETPVALRSAKRVRNKHVKNVASQAESCLNQLRNSMKNSCSSDKSAGQIPYYWDFYQKISELMDELGEQIKDVRAQS